MKFLYYCNVAILAFSLTILGGLLRMFAVAPQILYAGLIIAIIVLFLGIFPYRIRSRNPLVSEFLAMFVAVIMGTILWF